jgi:glucose-6-phosphate isomerase
LRRNGNECSALLEATGKPLTNIVAVGIGGSFLGPLFVHTALRTDGEAAANSRGRQLRFLANVDPVDVARSLNGMACSPLSCS